MSMSCPDTYSFVIMSSESSFISKFVIKLSNDKYMSVFIVELSSKDETECKEIFRFSKSKSTMH